MNFPLTLARYRFTAVAATPLHFPAYAGSTWRGAFGHALRHTVCITREPSCQACLLARSCVYSQIFETPAEQQPLLEKVNTAPHPYILHPLNTSGKTYMAGEKLELYCTLMGKAIAQLPYIIHSLQQVGERGIGKHDGKFVLTQVEQERVIGNNDWQVIYQAGGSLQALSGSTPSIESLPEQVKISFHTPYRSIQEGKLVRAQRFSFQPFMNSLMRRISLLHSFHADTVLEADFKTLSQQAEKVDIINPQLQWYEWSRYSNRQQSKVQMGGLLGSFELKGEAIAPFWAWLHWGQWVHAGKGAVMGMGEYRLDKVN